MKKTFLLAIVFVAFTLPSEAQETSQNAIGLRLSDSDGFGTEVNYQRAIGTDNRLEFGLAWHGDDYVNVYKLTGLFQWMWNIDDGFNWYAGPGIGFGQVDIDEGFFNDDRFDDELFAFLTGVAGIEYNFDIPLKVSFDFRPEISTGDYRDDVNFDIGVAARYRF